MIELKNKHKNRIALILCAGSNVLEYKNEIRNFIEKNEPIVIGINHITSFMIPHYHLWTNNGRLKIFGSCIHPSSILLLGENINKSLKENMNFINISYKDQKDLPIKIKEKSIQGYFRTAGCLAICFAYYMGINDIYIVGMDGYTFIPEHNLKNDNKSQHLYGYGLTDNNEWEICKEKDKIVQNCLNNIKEYGINFNIITPTIFKNHYKNILCI